MSWFCALSSSWSPGFKLRWSTFFSVRDQVHCCKLYTFSHILQIHDTDRSEIYPWVVYIKRLKPICCYCCILHLQCCLLLFPGQSIPALLACTQALACYTHTSQRPQWCQNIFKLQSKFLYILCLLINYLLQYFVTLPHKHEMEGHSYCGTSTGFNPIHSPPHQPSLAWKHKVHPHSFPPIPTQKPNAVCYHMQIQQWYNLWTQRREMGRGHR